MQAPHLDVAIEGDCSHPLCRAAVVRARAARVGARVARTATIVRGVPGPTISLSLSLSLSLSVVS